MKKANEPELADVGVIVGRFQVDELHEAHVDLIQTVIDSHPKVIIFLGLSALKGSGNNSLDLEARRQMINEKFPDVNIAYIKDMRDDEKWSKKLDENIGDQIGPTQSVVLYGGRDAFISRYYGRYNTQELQQTVFISGKDVRKAISNKVKATKDFRTGVIWNSGNRYPVAYPTVDVAIFNDDYTQILLARKPNEDLYRLVGGFVEPGQTLEATARREVQEETGLAITDPVYVTSQVVDDWRYRGEVDGIITSLFMAKRMFGKPEPNDDICELKWFDMVAEIGTNMNEHSITNFIDINVVEEHRDLVFKVLTKVQSNREKK